MLAVQGPQRAGHRRASWPTGACPSRFHCCSRVVAGVPMLVCGTGYTGEDGVELLLDPGDATRVWDALIGAGVAPVGLGARDTLRLEVNYHLYGNDMDETRNPIEAGLGWACKEATGFVGSEAVARRARARHRREARRLRDDRARHRAPGQRRSSAAASSRPGTMSPTLGVGIGMAYVPADRAEPGTAFEIDVRGTDPRRRGPTQTPLSPGGRWLTIRPTSSTTPSTTGRAWTATPPRSASPGTRRTRSARSSSSTRRRSARRSPRTSPTRRSSPSRPSRT